jgi:hypothetical protein
MSWRMVLMWGYTLIGFDGGEIFTSEPEYESKVEANKHAINALTDEPYAGSCEVWAEEE